MKTVFLFNPFHSIHRQHNKIITVLIEQILFEICKLKKKFDWVKNGSVSSIRNIQWSIQLHDQYYHYKNWILIQWKSYWQRLELEIAIFNVKLLKNFINCTISESKNLLKLSGSLQFLRFFFPNKIMCTKETYKKHIIKWTGCEKIQSYSWFHGAVFDELMINTLNSPNNLEHSHKMHCKFVWYWKKKSSSNSAQCSNQRGFRVPLVGSNTENYQVAHKRWRESLT